MDSMDSLPTWVVTGGVLFALSLAGRLANRKETSTSTPEKEEDPVETTILDAPSNTLSSENDKDQVVEVNSVVPVPTKALQDEVPILATEVASVPDQQATTQVIPAQESVSKKSKKKKKSGSAASSSLSVPSDSNAVPSIDSTPATIPGPSKQQKKKNRKKGISNLKELIQEKEQAIAALLEKVSREAPEPQEDDISDLLRLNELSRGGSGAKKPVKAKKIAVVSSSKPSKSSASQRQNEEPLTPVVLSEDVNENDTLNDAVKDNVDPSDVTPSPREMVVSELITPQAGDISTTSSSTLDSDVIARQKISSLEALIQSLTTEKKQLKDALAATEKKSSTTLADMQASYSTLKKSHEELEKRFAQETETFRNTNKVLTQSMMNAQLDVKEAQQLSSVLTKEKTEISSRLDKALQEVETYQNLSTSINQELNEVKSLLQVSEEKHATELKELSSQLSCLDQARLNLAEENAQLKNKVTSTESSLSHLHTSLSQIQDEKTNLELSLGQAYDQVSSLQNQLSSANHELSLAQAGQDSTQSQLSQALSQLDAMTKENLELKSRTELDEKKIQALNKTVADLNDHISVLTNERDALENARSSLKAQLDANTLDSEKTKSDLKDLHTRYEDLEKAKKETETQLSTVTANFEKKIIESQKAFDSFKTESIELSQRQKVDLDGANEEKKRLQDANSQLETSLAQHAARLESQNSRIEELSQQLIQAHEGLAAQRSFQSSFEFAEGLAIEVEVLKTSNAELKKQIADARNKMNHTEKKLKELPKKNGDDSLIKVSRDILVSQAETVAGYDALIGFYGNELETQAQEALALRKELQQLKKMMVNKLQPSVSQVTSAQDTKRLESPEITTAYQELQTAESKADSEAARFKLNQALLATFISQQQLHDDNKNTAARAAEW